MSSSSVLIFEWKLKDGPLLLNVLLMELRLDSKTFSAVSDICKRNTGKCQVIVNKHDGVAISTLSETYKYTDGKIEEKLLSHPQIFMSTNNE